MRHVSGSCLGDPDTVFNYVELMACGSHAATSSGGVGALEMKAESLWAALILFPAHLLLTVLSCQG